MCADPGAEPVGERLDALAGFAEMGKISRSGLRCRANAVTWSRSKSKYGRTSILLTIIAPQVWKMSGYLSGLSCPSGTERIIRFRCAPVSNSAGQTRLPTFSRMTRSSPAASSCCSPSRVILASRWHMPPVCSWMTFAPVRETVSASTSESISASITPTRSCRCSSGSRRRSVVV